MGAFEEAAGGTIFLDEVGELLLTRMVGKAGRYLEVEGAADLVVECVSDGSVHKDTIRLRDLYHRAGAREYWIVDARGPVPSLEILLHHPGD